MPLHAPVLTAKLPRKHAGRLLTLIMAVLLLWLPCFQLVYGEGTIAGKDQQIIRELILESYVEAIDPDLLKTITPAVLENLLDPNSYYIPRQRMLSLLEEYQGEFEGIGAYIFEDSGRIYIAEPMPHSPAEAAGLLPGDTILAVDSTSLENLSLEEAVTRIKGPKGTQVTLTIQRAGEETPRELTLVRQSIQVPSIATQVFHDHIGYLQVRQFTENTAENTLKAIETLHEAGVDRLVIDLRGNPGGLLIEGVEFASLFLPKGPVTHVIYRQGSFTYSSFVDKIPFNPIVLLVDGETASAAEIFTAAFKDRGRGIIIGETTYGKGSVQRVYTLPSGAGFKQTEAIYLSPLKYEIDHLGVTPDIPLQRFPSHIQLEDLEPLAATRRLTRGDTGQAVTGAQQRLQYLGYVINDPLGVYGPDTAAAVAQFQTHEELFSYGVLDFATQAALHTAFIDWIRAPEQDLPLTTAIQYLLGQRSSHAGVVPVPIGAAEAQ